MKKIIAAVAIISMMYLPACKNAEKKDEAAGNKTEKLKTPADSLMKDVMDGHDAVMPKMGKLKLAERQAKRMLDSIAALPAKARAEASALKLKLETLINDLDYADFAMDKWMTEFNMDSAKDNIEQRIKYLAEEKLKVTKVKESILDGLARADSLLKAKR